MANQQLLEYVRESVSKGVSVGEIKNALLSAGWPGNEIDSAINLIHPQMADETPIPAVSAIKMGRFRASYLLVVESFELLRKDKEVIFFPILSTIFNLIVFAALALFFYTTLYFSGVESKNMEDPEGGFAVVNYIFIFLVYLASIFITTFFNAGLVSIVLARINGQDLSFSDGIKNSLRNIWKIFAWSLIAATLGLIMKIIFDRSRLLGRIVISILGATWGVLTFFIVPVLVSENKSALASIKESSITFKRVWGETLIMNFSMGLFFGIVYLLGFVACFAIFIATLFLGNFYVILMAAFLAIIFFVVTAVISSTLNAIFKVVLYEYARYGRMPANFTPKLILNAIKKKD